MYCNVCSDSKQHVLYVMWVHISLQHELFTNAFTQSKTAWTVNVCVDSNIILNLCTYCEATWTGNVCTHNKATDVSMRTDHTTTWSANMWTHRKTTLIVKVYTHSSTAWMKQHLVFKSASAKKHVHVINKREPRDVDV